MKLEDDKMCFICGEKNPIGLKLKLSLENDILKTKYKVEKRHQGYKNVAHGGIIAAILDEIMVNLLWLTGTPAVTAEFTVRFKKPIAVGDELEFISKKIKEQGRLFLIESHAKKVGGDIVATATAKCIKI